MLEALLILVAVIFLSVSLMLGPAVLSLKVLERTTSTRIHSTMAIERERFQREEKAFEEELRRYFNHDTKK